LKRPAVLKNSIQEYAWGSKTFIPQLLGDPVPAEIPQAELWMGAHPKAPSQVFCDGNWISLLELIQERPGHILGPRVAERFSHKLPFLFKVLAASKPLSIQAHPDKKQAREGFSRENMMKIPLDAPHRNYRDENHKPELFCALMPFWALKGFREIGSMITLMDKIGPVAHNMGVDILRNQPNEEGLRDFFESLMAMEREKQRNVVTEVVACGEKYSETDPVFEWLTKLNREYPGDIGVLSPLFLNVIQLRPGEAIFIPSGELHAYLDGAGLELMANSDNVLRGGLTSKHIDIPELLMSLNFTSNGVNILTPEIQGPGERVYPTLAEEFMLSMITLDEGSPQRRLETRSVEILICTEGAARITEPGSRDGLDLYKGTVILIPAAVTQYQIEGDATLYKASVPL
jgi:mannose-6-phosphate isomerase